MRRSLVRSFAGLLRRVTPVAAAAALAWTAPAAAQCQLQKLLPMDPGDGDQFGDSIAVSGEWMVVGASRDDTPFESGGSAYIFRDNGLGWEEFDKIVPPSPSANDLFGWAVDIDADAPGGPILVVGAYLHDQGAENAGAVYVYRFLGGEWTFETKLLAVDFSSGEQVGQSVAVDDTLVVAGAPRADGTASDEGAVLVWRRVGVNWGPSQRLMAETPSAQDRLGSSVDVDVDATGGASIVGGSPLDDVDALNNAGSVTTFQFNGSVWARGPLLTDETPGSGDNFGHSVALGGDVLAVGAWLDDNTGTNTGTVSILRNDGQWFFETRLQAVDGSPNDQFGRDVGVAPAGDIVIVGAAQVDSAGLDAGAAYLYREAGGFWSAAESRLTARDAEANATFGAAVDVSANVVAIGARGDDDDVAGPNAGAAYAFTATFEFCDDCNENFIADFLEIDQDPDLDCDEDGVLDVCQIRFDSPAGEPGEFFCIDDCDADCNDNGVVDSCDIAGPVSADLNENGIPDECEDCNNNGIPDSIDIKNGEGEDCNGNDLLDECDIELGLEPDCNENGIPDTCDIASGASGDCNEDGVPDDCNDCDGNGIDDQCDIDAGGPDLNGDGILDFCQDCNENGFPDFIEISVDPSIDCNGNGRIDDCEIVPNEQIPGGPFYCLEDCDPDCNNNGIPDSCDIASGSEDDEDLNGVPDSCEDCNDNNIPDGLDIADGFSSDCDQDGVPDECQILAGSVPGGPWYCTSGCDDDCNGNGIPDVCDIADGIEEDCDGNGIPDPCDLDCNGNGVPDGCDIVDGTSTDFNGNGVPDDCDPDCDGDGFADFIEIQFGTEEDCDENGVPDSCDIADGTWPDGDGNGIPDVCEILPMDIDGDGFVSFSDTLLVLANYGMCPDPPAECIADVNDDDTVNIVDLLLVLGNWS
ncbi:MAG: hypothetical protein AB8G96_06305 [Phycisphaerales bacterium]